MEQRERPRVVIVGAGFGGLWAAKALRKSEVDVEVIDRHNYHTFFPLLYQVAAAELAPGDIAHPIRKIIRRQRNARFTLAGVIGIDSPRKVVLTTAGARPYDYLIIGTGSTTRHFGVAGAEDHSYPLRTLQEAIDLRNRILARFEIAEHQDRDDRTATLTFVVVGGGPTGVEFSGALQELINGPLAKDHPRLDLERARVILVEAGDALLPIYPNRLSRFASKRLQRMGVDVRLGAVVEQVDGGGVRLVSGERIDAATVVWTAGVGGPAELAQWGLTTGSSGRATVQPDLRLAGFDGVFVVGDASEPIARSSPTVAQNATQQGTLAARNVMRSIAHRPLEQYRYRNLGNMAVIGRNAAIVHLFGRIAFQGYPAWLMWLALHLAKLVGFRNRIAAMLSWSGDYLFRDRVARVITSEPGDSRAFRRAPVPKGAQTSADPFPNPPDPGGMEDIDQSSAPRRRSPETPND
jgi:NADH dehydrogenase